MDHHMEARVVLLPGLYIQLRSFDALVTLTLKVSSRWSRLCPSECDPAKICLHSSENDSR
jgi:hypothetical protein